MTIFGIILTTHSIVALASFGFLAASLMTTSSAWLNRAAWLFVATIGSGAVLIFMQPVSLGKGCASLAVYSAAFLGAGYVARSRNASVSRAR